MTISETKLPRSAKAQIKLKSSPTTRTLATGIGVAWMTWEKSWRPGAFLLCQRPSREDGLDLVPVVFEDHGLRILPAPIKGGFVFTGQDVNVHENVIMAALGTGIVQKAYSFQCERLAESFHAFGF